MALRLTMALTMAEAIRAEDAWERSLRLIQPGRIHGLLFHRRE